MTDAAHVVLDTNVLVSALWSANGNPAQIAHMIPEKRIIPFFCDEILLEYRVVLFRAAFHFSDAQIEDLLGNLVQYGQSVVVHKSNIRMPDESDRVFYDVAKTCDAYLITGNIRHYPNEPLIITPAEFIQLMKSEN
jgi:putative PIN family toxin of toxin-antitoxin system